MSHIIKIKHTATSGKTPTTADISLGELAINTHDGKLFMKKDDGTASIVEFTGGVTISAGDGLSLSSGVMSVNPDGTTLTVASSGIKISDTVMSTINGKLDATAKAADSDKLDGHDSTYFATATHNHDTIYLGINAKAADSNLLDGNDSSAFAKINTTSSTSGYLYVNRSSTSPAMYVRQGSTGDIAKFFVNSTSGSTSGTDQLLITKSGGITLTGVINSSVATGTAPLIVSSTTKVTNLNADLLDDLNSSQFLRSDVDTVLTGSLEIVPTSPRRYIVRTLVSDTTDSYRRRVITLLPKHTTAAAATREITGRISATKDGANIYNIIDIGIQSVYGSTKAFIECVGDQTNHSLVEFDYNGITWIGILLHYSANPYHHYHFDGWAFSDVQEGNMLKVISYYDEGTTTIDNSEIYNSLTSYTGNEYVRKINGSSVVTETYGMAPNSDKVDGYEATDFFTMDIDGGSY